VTERRFISRFSPNRTAPEDLEQINVQRQGLIDEVVGLLRESALKKSKHHLLFVGPRGCGKTHLLALVNSRLGKQKDLASRLRIAWLGEDETSTSFLDLLVRIYRALSARYQDEFPPDDLKQVYGTDPDRARESLGEALVKHAKRRTVLVMIENLDGLFRDLDEGEQRSWRAFLQNHPIFATAATAQSLSDGVSSHGQPFFGFFDVRHLTPLTFDEATELLRKLAALDPSKGDLAEFLATPRGRARVRAIHHLSGGNHRLFVVLSELLTKESLDELVRPFEEMVDEQLTPYYQERLRWLSPLQRKIVEHLCFRSRPVPVKEIADGLFAAHSTITPQLKQLREMGYVVPNPRGRESLYELAEPLMRLSMQVKDTQQSQPLGLLVDFLRVWYDRDELAGRLASLSPDAACREYLMAALEKTESGELNLRHELLRDALEGVSLDRCTNQQLQEFRDLAEDSGDVNDWWRYGAACYERNLPEQAVEAFSKAAERASKASDPQEEAGMLLCRALALVAAGRHLGAVAEALVLAERKDLPADVTRLAVRIAALPMLVASDSVWKTALERIPAVLASEDAWVAAVLSLSAIDAAFRQFGSPEVWQMRVKELVEVFAKHNRLSQLGRALVAHIGRLKSARLNQQGLNAWLGHWQSAAGSFPAMVLPLRLLAVGIEYISSQPKDESILLKLPMEERRILQQALGLEIVRTRAGQIVVPALAP
jgi:DNA-binding transcriptional ArsR family regulator